MRAPINLTFSAIFTSLLIASAPQGAAAAESLQELKKNFENPPDDTRPGCYWYWINDNISTQGLTKDLESMAEVGIGRAYIGHIFTHDRDVDTPVGDVKFQSDQWWEALQWAVKEADRCGVDIGFFNAPGWSQSGGPWIKPEESMRYLGHSETVVTGGKTVEMNLPIPEIDTFPNSGGMTPKRQGPNFTPEDFKDVSVVAYKHPKENLGRITAGDVNATGDLPNLENLFDGSDATSATFAPGQVSTITLQLPKEKRGEHPVQGVLITPLEHSYTLLCTVEISDDGETFRELTKFEEQRGHQGPKNQSDIVVPLGPIDAEHIRLTLQFNFGPAGRKLKVAEIALTTEAMVPGYARKQLGETSPAIIIPPSAYIWDHQTSVAEGTAIQSEQVVDLSDKMDAAGRLVWDAPAGTWTILRTGMIPIGTMCAPCSPESRGLEIDKLSRQHATAIFEGMVGEFIKRTPEADRKALKYIIADSYETGPQNWTDGFIEKFNEKYGYSPVRFLPVMTGRVVDSPEVSDRFLWDLRNLIVESVAYEYVGGLREIANKNGLILWLENYGHWGYISEFLLYGSQTDEVGGEFWESSNPVDNVECRAAASSAHIYGKRDVYAEAFTSGRTFKQTPASLKRWCDWAFGTGINHMILHVYIHQAMEKKPGIIQWFGTAFNRHNTWFSQSVPFMEYMRRGAVMLKAGKPVADVAYYIGENSPSMTGPTKPALPEGYDFDHVNADVLINGAAVKDGRLVLNDNTSYALLVLPESEEMRPEVAEAIKRLVNEGAVVVGPKPVRSPSLQNYPQCDVRVQELAGEIWGDVDGSTVKERQFGNGWIHHGLTLPEVFAKHGVTPDLDLGDSTELPCAVAGNGTLGVNENGGILFKHRTTPDAEIYFVSNTSKTSAALQASFRQENRKPYLWNAVDATVTEARAFRREGGRTIVPLDLEPSQSMYVVFGEGVSDDAGAAGASAAAAASNSPARQTLVTLNDDWTVKFKGFGAPESIAFTTLTDWIRHPDENIRHYSGSATYEKVFDLAEVPKGKVVLSLGNVSTVATVEVNGKNAGTLWTNPWELDITDYLETGSNVLQIQVTNNWNNRLSADAQKPEAERKTYVSEPYVYDKKSPFITSGLLGPVTVETVELETEKARETPQYRGD